MPTIEGTHQHATTGRRLRFTATYTVIDDDLRWAVVWWSADGRQMQRDGTIAEAQRLALPHRAVIECVVDAINES